MMDGGLDARNFVYLPGWAKATCLATLVLGIVVSTALIIAFFGSSDSRDWVVIGISGVQFLITTLVVAVILFWSQTDANIATLKARGEAFLRDTLVDALAGMRLEDDTMPLTVARPDAASRDLFGYPYEICRAGMPVLRVWVGVNVHRLIVIYRFVDPVPDRTIEDFSADLSAIFGFSLGAVEPIGYQAPRYEPVPSDVPTIAVWLPARAEANLLTDPAAKLFWAQDIAMMTQSILRTMRRHRARVLPDLVTWPRPQ